MALSAWLMLTTGSTDTQVLIPRVWAIWIARIRCGTDAAMGSHCLRKTSSVMESVVPNDQPVLFKMSKSRVARRPPLVSTVTFMS